jgi:hypothetical protein
MHYSSKSRIDTSKLEKQVKALHLLEMSQLKVLLPYFIFSHSIKALTISFNKSVSKRQQRLNIIPKYVNLTRYNNFYVRPVITKLVHEGIQHRWGAMSINTVVAIPLHEYDTNTQENSNNVNLQIFDRAPTHPIKKARTGQLEDICGELQKTSTQLTR